jgi:hypothetical protein
MDRLQFLTLASVASLGLGSCARSEESCASLRQQYADEIHDVAIRCDPAAANPCGGQLPVVVYEEDPDGGLTLETLASNCTHAVNPERMAGARQILDHYLSQQCPTMATPICQGHANECTDRLPDGSLMCH